MSCSASSSSTESLGFPPNRRALRAADSMDELDVLGFAGIPRRYQAPRRNDSSSSTSSSSSISPFDVAPPPSYYPPTYVKFESPEHMLGGYAECGVSDDVIMITNGDVIKAKLRYRIHKLRMGKHADEWHVFLNRSLKPGEAPWAPAGSPMWKVSRAEFEGTVHGSRGIGGDFDSARGTGAIGALTSASMIELGMDRRSSI